MQNISQQTLANIVSSNHLAAPILERYHLDYCCKGKRILADACNEKGIKLVDVIQDLLVEADEKKTISPSFSEMSASQLVAYIVSIHHAYVKQAMPLIHSHLEKVAFKHGDHFPYMKEVAKLFSEIKEEMTSHMDKEETILFPIIYELEKNINTGKRTRVGISFIEGPVTLMENEHEQAGNILDKIRALTENYTAPANACNTFILCLAELEEFEADLHKHVHLENNILFPKALLMTTKN